MTAPYVLEVQQLIKRFGQVTAVDGLSFAIAPGECVGILGPNGAGKTTTLEIVEGLQEPTSGTVRLFGQTWREGGLALRSRIGIQLQETRFRDKLTAQEVVRLFASFYEKSLPAEEALRSVSLQEQAKTLVMNLSGGQRQRLALAVALVSDPELLFQDEPTTGLDPHARRELWDLIRALHARGRTVVLTTHYLEEATALCDRVIIIDHGKIIAQGAPRALISSLSNGAVVDLETEPALEEDALLAVPGVLSVRKRGSAWEISVRELHTSVPALLGMVSQRGVKPTRLSTREPTLEDVFLSLTGRVFEVPEPANTDQKAAHS